MELLLTAYGVWRVVMGIEHNAQKSALAALIIKRHLSVNNKLYSSPFADGAKLWSMIQARTTDSCVAERERRRREWQRYNLGSAPNVNAFLLGKEIRMEAYLRAGGHLYPEEIFEDFVEGVAAVDIKTAGTLKLMARGGIEELKHLIREHTAPARYRPRGEVHSGRIPTKDGKGKKGTKRQSQVANLSRGKDTDCEVMILDSGATRHIIVDKLLTLPGSIKTT